MLRGKRCFELLGFFSERALESPLPEPGRVAAGRHASARLSASLGRAGRRNVVGLVRAVHVRDRAVLDRRHVVLLVRGVTSSGHRITVGLVATRRFGTRGTGARTVLRCIVAEETRQLRSVVILNATRARRIIGPTENVATSTAWRFQDLAGRTVLAIQSLVSSGRRHCHELTRVKYLR